MLIQTQVLALVFAPIIAYSASAALFIMVKYMIDSNK